MEITRSTIHTKVIKVTFEVDVPEDYKFHEHPTNELAWNYDYGDLLPELHDGYEIVSLNSASCVVNGKIKFTAIFHKELA